MAHSAEHFNATQDYLAVHGRRARRVGALERLMAARGAEWRDPIDLARIEREIATLESRIGAAR